MSTYVNKARRLAELMKQFDAMATEVGEIIREAPTKGDFNFVSDFKDEYGAPLKDAPHKIKSFANDLQWMSNVLPHILYFREAESINPELAEWKKHVNPHAVNNISPTGWRMMFHPDLGVDSPLVAQQIIEFYIKDPW